MVRILWCQKLHVVAIKTDAIEMREIRITTCIFPYSQKVNDLLLLIDIQHLRDIAFTFGDLILQLASFQIIQVQLPSYPAH